MKRLLLLTLLIIAVLVAYWKVSPANQTAANTDTPASSPVIHFATEGAYPPFNFIDNKGTLRGFDIDIAYAICEVLDATCKFSVQDWDGLIPGLRAKKFDAIIASMSVTDERKRAVAFSDRYYNTPIRFITANDETLIISEEGLKHKTIGAQRATTSSKFLKEKFGSGVKVNLYDTQENANLDLKNGRVDAVVADALVLYNWLKSPEGQGHSFRGEAFYVDDGIAIATRKDDVEFLGRINQALQDIHDNGMYDKITDKYFSYGIY